MSLRAQRIAERIALAVVVAAVAYAFGVWLSGY